MTISRDGVPNYLKSLSKLKNFDRRSLDIFIDRYGEFFESYDIIENDDTSFTLDFEWSDSV